MAIASGTCGTCSWAISDAGVLTIGAGTLHAPWLTGIMSNNWPWGGHAKDIKSCVIASGVIVGAQEGLMGGYTNDYSTAHMFYGCSNMTSITFQGTFNTVNATDIGWMFDGCSSLTSINLSTFNTAKVKSMSYLFSGCTILTSITFGANFDTSALDESSGTAFLGSGFYSAVNNTNGLVINSDAAFRALLASEKTGTWVRQPASVTYSVSAVRTDNGTVDEDGEDVTITATWLTGASTTTRTLSVYKKLASESSYPASAAATETLSGNSGTTSITLSALGNDAYDFRVEFYDGTNKYIAFPSVASNIILVTIDPDGVPSCHNVKGDFGTIFELIYPVGAIYMSTSNVSPALMFGGTWEQIQNRFLLAAGSSYSAGSTGGSADASLVAHTHSVSGTAASNGAHTHGMGNVWSDGTGSSSAYMKTSKRTLTTRNTGSAGAHTHSVTGTAASNGVAATGKNMPPYLAVYVWKRTA